MINPKGRFGTLPVFLTAISTILGAILFLRFGFAVGNVGFWGTVGIIVMGHLVTIPTAMAIAEISTNQKVEGGGEYFIISRSFGINIGAAIGLALYLSQAISVAFYVIAFGEAFEPLIAWVEVEYGFHISKWLISLASMALLALVILKKGASIGVKVLYVVVAVLFVSLVLFFMGSSTYVDTFDGNILNNKIDGGLNFFAVFAICFPAFTGMTAGVGLSGDLKNPGRSIPLGTLAATLFGMVVYIFIAYKLAISASATDLANNQFQMMNIAFWGPIIPIGLACATISSALGSILVAPRTLQAIAGDKVFPNRKANYFLSKGKGKDKEPYNASIITIIIAFGIIAIGDVNFVAEIITMFFMVTYGSLCLISFLHHFNADPSYRPSFKSKWYVSLFGAVICIWLMFQINFPYATAALIVMVFLYLFINYYNQHGRGLVAIFQGAIFQMSRSLQVYLQKAEKKEEDNTWRPSIICVSKDSFNRFTAFELLKWISYKYGFGTYIHQLDGYYSRSTKEESDQILGRLIEMADESNVYLETIISPSYTSAIAQAIQLPGISGKENNMALFEYSKHNPENLKDIIDNYHLVKAGDFDICILGSSERGFGLRRFIHIWIRPQDVDNANLMILMSYILMGHPDWGKAIIKIYAVFPEATLADEKEKLVQLVQTGRLPISINNLEVLALQEEMNIKTLINEKSQNACLTLIGFRSETVKNKGTEIFQGYENLGTVLFVNSGGEKVIK